jgi:sugar phosphate isomerase/epimerase
VKANYSISISTVVYALQGRSLERALCGIHKAGFEHIELASVVGHAEHAVPERMKEDDYRRLENLLKEFDVSVPAISGHVDLVGRKSTIPGVREVLGPDRALEMWKNRIDLAARLGASIVNNSAGELETREDYDTFYKYIRFVEDYCSRKGVRIALETHGSIIGKELRPIMEKLNSKWIGINYDTANVRYYRNVQAEDDIENVIDWIFNIHMKDHIGGKGDYNFPAVGDGEVHFHQIFRILKKHDWKGPVSAEIEYEGPDAPKRPPDRIDIDVKRSYDYTTRLLERY